MRTKLFQVYWKLRSVIAPNLTHAQHLYEEVLGSHIKPGTKWLDLGCGHQVLPFWRAAEEQKLVARCAQIVGMDYDLPSLQKHRSVSQLVRGHIDTLPFKDNHFDLVTANMVVEHLANPALQFSEIHRVLKPGGVFLFHTPNALGYPTVINRMVPEQLKHKLIYILDGRKEDDVFETHYAANTRAQISALSESTGFEVALLRFAASDAVFALIAPVAIPELIYLRLLMTERFKKWRTNIITVLRKEPAKGLPRVVRKEAA
jgi:ubiquinone/menaquinone biosynthesis C-methylase UbiE